MGKKPARKRGARRLNVTPELLANIRHRYEHSAERLAPMAADLGCCTETVRNIAKREGWVAYVAPPRDLSPAARLRERAERLAGQQTPLIPAQAGIQGHTEGPCHAAPGSPLSRGRAENEDPLAGGRADDMATEQTDPAANAALHAAATAQMLREVAGFLDGVRAERKRMKREGYAKHELQDVARVIADLAASLKRLQPMAPRAAEPDTGNAQDDSYDDRPADLDQFREDLARRIRLFVERRRAGSSVSEPAAADAAATEP